MRYPHVNKMLASDIMLTPNYREGGVRRRHGLRSFRLSVCDCQSSFTKKQRSTNWSIVACIADCRGRSDIHRHGGIPLFLSRFRSFAGHISSRHSKSKSCFSTEEPSLLFYCSVSLAMVAVMQCCPRLLDQPKFLPCSFRPCSSLPPPPPFPLAPI